MTKEEKGVLAVLKAQQRAVELGWLVSVPTSLCRYDLVLDDGKRLYRAQVKYANGVMQSQGGVRVGLEKHKKRYSRAEVDVVLAYLPSVDRVCWFDPEVFEGRFDLYIRVAPAKNNQKRKCLLATEHFW